jgi:hypothetical protein
VSSVKSVMSTYGQSAPNMLVTSGAWSADTKRVAQIVMAWTAPETIDVLEAMPDSSASLAGWFAELKRATAAGAVRNYFDHTAELVQSTSVAAMSAKLTQVYAEFTQGATPAGPQIDTSRLFQQTAPARNASVDSVTQIAEPLQVVGTAVKSQMPLWGWIAIGTGVVAAAGVLIWGIATKPKRK